MRLSLPRPERGDRPPAHFAEVIETATAEFLAQCLDPEDLSFPEMPSFGSWVKASDEDSGNQIYAIVYHATTTPIDSLHRARALGLSLEALRNQQPQIFSMLKTEFRAAIVGFRTAGPPARLFHHLPPRPPQVHQAVYRCLPEDVFSATEELNFLHTLLQTSGTPTDALIAATMREIYALRQGDRPWLVQASRFLGVLLKDDYDRLRLILNQVHL
jgi:hypothetical protein